MKEQKVNDVYIKYHKPSKKYCVYARKGSGAKKIIILLDRRSNMFLAELALERRKKQYNVS